MHRLEVAGFAMTNDGGTPLVLLRSAEGERLLPIGIGPVELSAIATRLAGLEPERPLTHDLLKDIVEQIGAFVACVEITELHDSVFRAAITLSTGDGEVDVDARPSDAIALAVRTDAPIFASDQVMDEGSVAFEPAPDPEQAMEEFREFLESVSPSEFGDSDGSTPTEQQ
jgi:uncharacterized protein